MTQRLQAGDELQCPHCERWHPVFTPHTDGTEATLQMLYWECGQARYFAGAIGTTARFPTRAAAPPLLSRPSR